MKMSKNAYLLVLCIFSMGLVRCDDTITPKPDKPEIKSSVSVLPVKQTDSQDIKNISESSTEKPAKPDSKPKISLPMPSPATNIKPAETSSVKEDPKKPQEENQKPIENLSTKTETAVIMSPSKNMVKPSLVNPDTNKDETKTKNVTPSQIKEIENSIFEETSEFKSANIIRNSSKIQLGKVYEISEKRMVYTVKSDYSSMKNKFHLLIVKGGGTLFISTKKMDRSHEKAIKIKLDSSYEMTYIPINSLFYFNRAGDNLEIKVERGLMGLIDIPELKIEFVEAIEMEFNQNHRVITHFSEKILYKVVRPELHANKEGKDDRLQFILQSSLNKQEVTGRERISMFINSHKEFPSHSRFDFRAAGNMGYGLIKSLNKDNKNYCIKRGCEYYVSIYVKHVDVLFFFPTVFANFSNLKFHKYLYLLEEVEGEERVSYELDVPEHQGDWSFTIQPIEGYPRMFINPDVIAKNLEDSKYKSITAKAEEITITYDQSKKYGFSHKKFFVTFTQDGPQGSVASFKFEVNKLLKNQAKYLQLDYAETGVVANHEIVQYKLNFVVDQPEVINFELNLMAIVGNSMLILKECDGLDTCKITRDDVSVCKKRKKRKRKQTVSEEAGSSRILEQLPLTQNPQNYQQYYGQQPVNNNRYQQPMNNNQYQQPMNNSQYQQPINNNQYQQPMNNSQYQQQNNYLNPNSGSNPRQNYQPNPANNSSYQGVPYNQNKNLLYFPDTDDPSQYGVNQEMVNHQDILQAESEQRKQQQQNYQAQNNRNNLEGLPPLSQDPNLNSGNLQNYQLDKNLRPINTSQQELTSLPVKQMERQIKNPLNKNDTPNQNMRIKDQELNYIKDYTNLTKEQNKVEQNRFTNLDSAKKINEYINTDEQNQHNPVQMQEKPKGYEYDLKKKIDPTKIECVSGNGVFGARAYKTIFMNFNCLGVHNANKGKTFAQLDPKYPYLNNCLFGVGVYGNNSNSKKFGGSFYSVSGKGGLMHVDIPFKESKEHIVQDKQKKYLRFDLSKYNPSKTGKIKVKIVAITGVCNIYFSKYNQYPSKDDNEGMMRFSNEHFMSVRTSEKELSVDFDSWGNFASLFVTIESIQYSVLDIYAEKTSNLSENKKSNELLKKGKMVKRKLTRDNYVDFLSSNKKSVYARGFNFEMGEQIMGLDQSIKVVVNSNTIGLKICLQRHKKEYIPEEKCSITSESGVARIPTLINLLDPDSQWSVGVILELDNQATKVPKFPIEFSVIIYNGQDSDEVLHILDPGRSFESSINKKETVIFKVNMLGIEKKSLIILTSQDKSVKGEISLNKFDFSNPKFVLDSETFAIELNHRQQDIICELEEFGNCIFYIRISSKHPKNSRFNLIYTVDDIPITLKEGNELFIPNKDNMYFLYDPNPLYPAEFNLQSDLTEFLVYSKMLNISEIKRQPLTELLSEFNYDYKTDIGKDEQLRIPQKQINEAGKDRIIAYLVAPKFKKMDENSPTTLYSSASTTTIYVKSRMSKLDGFVEGRATLIKGQFRHFYFNVDNYDDFSLVMTVQSGKADLYLNKGLFNLPTLKNYWKKKVGSKEEEMMIRKEFFDNPKDIKGVYTAGIYARTNCKVAVVYLPSFDNLIKIKPQHLVNMKLRKNQPYYFEFFNKLPEWNLDLYTENSNLEVSIMDFSIHSNSDQDLVEMLKDDSKYFEHFSFVKGAVPLKHKESNLSTNKHYVIRVKALDEEAMLNLMIYEADKPIEIPSHKKITFTGNKDEEYVYISELVNNYEQAEINFKLFFGNVEFATANNFETLKTAKFTKFSLPLSKVVTFKPKSKSKDISLFNQFLIKVKTTEFSKFSIIVKGKEKFSRIKEFETEIIHTNADEEQNIYFYLSRAKAKTTHSLTFDINTLNFYNGKPKLFFNPDKDDIELGSETKLLPMPIEDMTDNISGEFRHIEIKPRIQNGYFIIQIPKNHHKLPIKISVGMNERRQLNPNGVYRYQLPNSREKKHLFSMYLSEKGEFRFLIESCKKVKVENAELHYFSKKEPVVFQENLVQALKYIEYDDSNSTFQKTYKQYATKVFRGIVDNSGVLEFKVKSSTPTSSFKGQNKDYLMITEFKPNRRNVFFKDYVNIWGDKKNKDFRQYSYKWVNDNSDLEVAIFLPRFREQLLMDFPDLKKIVIKFFVNLLDDSNFDKRIMLCGMSAVEEVPHFRLYHTEIVKVENGINKVKPLIFSFKNEQLENFSKSKKLSIFTYMSISFFENELEEFQVGLENKFAYVPYFLLRTRNLHGKSGWSWLTWIIFMIICLLTIFIFYLKNQNNTSLNDVRNMVNSVSPQENKFNKNEYQNPNDPQGLSDSGFINLNHSDNKISINEMTTIK